mmetsp:Transcript_17348/g.26291  ORF Transcript_17348/g.26291 Transcript_17348/m.26291 type:complete len:99 (-) Transcript_17348:2850-3146(-)
MSRGDQRERDRAKNQAKQAQKLKANTKGGDPLSRNQNDKAALEEKVARKKAMQKEQEEQALKNTTTKFPLKKKKAEAKDSLDDLLNAGISGQKKKGKK